ncbi:unnamed protein product, partial [Meganyctiphanes norvegica]
MGFKRRRGALIYLTASSTLLALGFLKTQHQGTFSQLDYLENTQWDSIGYDEYECGCPRSGQPITEEIEKSLCSDWATSRGSSQRVVSYSIYGNISDMKINKRYFSAIERRINEVAKYYKGWTVRLYHNFSSSDRASNGFLCNLYCKYHHFDPCQVLDLFPFDSSQRTPKSVTETNHDATNVHPNTEASARLVSEDNNHYAKDSNPSHPRVSDAAASSLLKRLTQQTVQSFSRLLIGKMWRFLVMADPLVSDFLVRDVDSVILPREVAAVEEWLYNSTAVLHAMRDHPSHNGLILAGMWGGSRARDGPLLKRLLEKMYKRKPREIWDYDQQLLHSIVWPEVLDTVLVHDAYYCANPHFRSHHRARAFPTQREGKFYVGWGESQNYTLDGIKTCPYQCRPMDHQDWTLC